MVARVLVFSQTSPSLIFAALPSFSLFNFVHEFDQMRTQVIGRLNPELELRRMIVISTYVVKEDV